MIIQFYCEQYYLFFVDCFVEGECFDCGYVDVCGDQCDLCGKFFEFLEFICLCCKVDGFVLVIKEIKYIFLELDKFQLEVEVFFQELVVKGVWFSNGILIIVVWFKEGLQL